MFNAKLQLSIVAILSGALGLAVATDDSSVDAAPRGNAPPQHQIAQGPAVRSQQFQISGGHTHSMLGRPQPVHRSLLNPRATGGPVCGGPTSPHPLIDHHGPLISNVQMYNIGWGPVQNGADLNRFAGWLASSWYVSNLAREYNDSQGRIGGGRFVRALAAPGRPGDVVRDPEIRTQIESLILHGQLPAGGPNNAFFVYLPPRVTAISFDGAVSCHGQSGDCFCGYHGWYIGNNNLPRFYAVIPDLSSDPGRCGGPFDPVGDRTVAVSHELAEMITDPSTISWYSNPGTNQDGKSVGGQEIGDVCNGHDRNDHANVFSNATTHGFWVQCEWSNRQNACTDSL